MATCIYGFGSYFNSKNYHNDIDILIVHDSKDTHSCFEAISLKKEILENLENADITILSKNAEVEFNFIEKSKASLIYKYNKGNKKSVIKKIMAAIHAIKHNK